MGILVTYMADFFCKYKISDLNEIKIVIEDLIYGVKSNFDISEEQDYRIKLVMNELLSNCFKYASADNEHPVQVDARLHDNHLLLAVLDMGDGFKHNENILDNIEIDDNSLLKEGGRGLLLVSSIASMLKYNRKGNRALARIDL